MVVNSSTEFLFYGWQDEHEPEANPWAPITLPDYLTGAEREKIRAVMLGATTSCFYMNTSPPLSSCRDSLRTRDILHISSSS